VQDSKFRRIAAVLMIAAVLYVGHGLHNGGSDGVPSLVNSAHAGGVAVDAFTGPNGGRMFGRIYTADASGRRLYIWDGVNMNKGAKLEYLGSVVVPENEATSEQKSLEMRQLDRQREAERVLINPEKAGFKPRTQP
jgi:hypothetical protein